MNKETKKYTVNIFGDQYVLVSNEPQDHIMTVAATVDALMRDIAETSNLSDGKKVAVLAALQITDKVVALETAAQREKIRHEALSTLIENECSSTCSS